MLIGALNRGSSSIKLQVFDASAQSMPMVHKIVISHLGTEPVWMVNGESHNMPLHVRDLSSALVFLLPWLIDKVGTIPLMGHRIVHGGVDFVQPVRMDENVVQRLHALTPLDSIVTR